GAVTGGLGDPLPGLTPDELAAFVAGREEFEEPEGVEDGLGPVFNATSCVACHSRPTVGGSASIRDTRIGKLNGGAFDGLANLGGSLLQKQGIGAVNGCNVAGEV